MPRAPKPKAPGEKLEWMKAHAHLRPKEALAEALKRWPDMKINNIHQLRHAVRVRGVPVPKASTSGQAASTETPPPTKPQRYGHRPLSASTKFILAQGADLSATEIIELGRKAGLTLSKGIVNGARTRHRNKPTGDAVSPPATQLAIPETAVDAVAARKPRRAHEQIVLPLGSLSEEEADFMGMALNLGWSRASRLLAQFRVQFFGMIKTHTNTNDE
jgi:hypothetical protein